MSLITRNLTITNRSLAKLAMHFSLFYTGQVISLVAVNQGSISPCLNLYMKVSKV
jgi:hypothetical protein